MSLQTFRSQLLFSVISLSLACAPWLASGGTPSSDLNQAKLHDENGRAEAALKAYSRVLEQDNRNIEALYRRAVLNKDLNRVAQGLRDVNQAVTLEPSNPQLLLLRSELAAKAGNHQAARSDLDRAVQIDPASAAAHLQLGNWYARAQNYEQAAAEYTTAIECSRSLWTAYQHRSVVRELMGDVAGAKADLRRSEELRFTVER